MGILWANFGVRIGNLLRVWSYDRCSAESDQLWQAGSWWGWYRMYAWLRCRSLGWQCGPWEVWTDCLRLYVVLYCDTYPIVVFLCFHKSAAVYLKLGIPAYLVDEYIKSGYLFCNVRLPAMIPCSNAAPLQLARHLIAMTLALC